MLLPWLPFPGVRVFLGWMVTGTAGPMGGATSAAAAAMDFKAELTLEIWIEGVGGGGAKADEAEEEDVAVTGTAAVATAAAAAAEDVTTPPSSA